MKNFIAIYRGGQKQWFTQSMKELQKKSVLIYSELYYITKKLHPMTALSPKPSSLFAPDGFPFPG